MVQGSDRQAAVFLQHFATLHVSAHVCCSWFCKPSSALDPNSVAISSAAASIKCQVTSVCWFKMAHVSTLAMHTA